MSSETNPSAVGRPDGDLDSLDRALYDAFMFGQMVLFKAHNIDIPTTDADKSWELLRDVASGKHTLTDGDALAKKYPQAAVYLSRAQPNLNEHQRVLAAAVLRGMSSSID